MKGRFILLIIALAIVFNESKAQVATTQYFMNSLPQYVTNNPAFIPKYKFALGIPGSMVDVNYYNSGFRYKDAVVEENGVRTLVLPQLSAALPKKTYITSTSQVDLFRLGIKMGSKSYLSLNSAVRGFGRTMIPKDAIALLANGNAAYVGKTMNISPQGDMTMYWENSIGVAITPVKDLTVGARVKLLNGFVNASTVSANATIYTTEDTVTLAADLDARTSGRHSFDDGFKLSNYAGNSGVAFDLGATFKPIEKLTLAASFIDIGSIKWKNDLTQYTLDKSRAVYKYTGLEVDKILNGESSSDQIVDTLKARFTPQEKAGSPYSTMLPAKMLISATYDVRNNFSVGSMVYAERFNGRLATGWSVGLNKHFGKVISTSLSYSVSNRSANNLGAGLSLNFTPIQIYVVGDNLLRLPVSTLIHQGAEEFVKSTQVFTLRAGVNFVWGWTTDDTKQSYNSRKGKPKGKASKPANIRKRR